LNNLNNLNEIIYDSSNLFLDNKIKYKFIIYINSNLIFEKNITDMNFYFNKINFLSLNEKNPYKDGNILVNYDFIMIPNRFFNLFYDVFKININFDLLYFELNNKKTCNDPIINFLIDYKEYNCFSYYGLKNNFIFENNGFDLNFRYKSEVFYKNKFCTLCKRYSNLKNNNSEIESLIYYFKKNRTFKVEEWCWLGHYIDFYQEDINQEVHLQIIFDIKIINYESINNSKFGIKTHYPLTYYNNWFFDIIGNNLLNDYNKINFNLKINKKNQYILFNFDNYLGGIEFEIKDFKILIF